MRGVVRGSRSARHLARARRQAGLLWLCALGLWLGLVGAGIAAFAPPPAVDWLDRAQLQLAKGELELLAAEASAVEAGGRREVRLAVGHLAAWLNRLAPDPLPAGATVAATIESGHLLVHYPAWRSGSRRLVLTLRVHLSLLGDRVFGGVSGLWVGRLPLPVGLLARAVARSDGDGTFGWTDAGGRPGYALPATVTRETGVVRVREIWVDGNGLRMVVEGAGR